VRFSLVGIAKIEYDFLEKVAKAAFSCLEETEGEIELKFVTDKQIQSLNRVYRGFDKPTDVLSFKISAEPLIGQVFICYTIAVEQAEKADKKAKDEIALLLVHGILHVFDYDHSNKNEENDMQDLEKEILSKVGVKR
jgi:probable rRNA maturation factor